MKIYLIRHGQTTGDIEDRFGGDYDDHLTALGETQAEKLAGELTKLNIEKIYYSPKIRAIETARILSANTQIPIEPINDLRERNSYGILTGKLRHEAEASHSRLIDALKDPMATIEGAEHYNHFKIRVLDVFKNLTEKPFKAIGVVTHGGVISCFLREIIGRERKKLDDCALIELEYQNGKYKILRSKGLELK
jgi:broad specificity phosphatase PhoE